MINNFKSETTEKINKTPRGFENPGVSVNFGIDFDETTLIQAAQKGNKKAFECLFFRYQKQISGLAFQIIGDQDGAKDATQETFIRVYHSLNKFKHTNKFKSWLYRITINICYDLLRREKRFRHETLEGQIIAESTNEENELFERIYELLEFLSTPQKTTFILREIEGMRYKEIAKILNCPTGTVRSHIFHARIKLKELVEKHYPDLLED